jgi:hypothetical protein
VLESRSAREAGISSEKVEGPMARTRGIPADEIIGRLDGYSQDLYYNGGRQCRRARATDLALQMVYVEQ